MCYHYKLPKSSEAIQRRFKTDKLAPDLFEVTFNAVVNGFDLPRIPLICHDDPNVLRMAHWGLLPAWSRDTEMARHTLNARLETLADKPAFQEVMHQRCIVPAAAFFEWKWLDGKGKRKEKYALSVHGEEVMALAGIWSDWRDTRTGLTRRTCSVVTCEAQGIMREIHNSALRMPVVLTDETRHDWMHGAEDVSKFVAFHAELLDRPAQLDLFGRNLL
jgi:putative SOS response-associated peptidase YedK